METNLSFEDVVLRIKKAYRQGALSFTLDRVEPALLPYLKKLIKQIVSLGFKKIAIYTNGPGFCDYKFAKAILEGNQNIIRIFLSLNGPDKKIHDQIAQQNRSFNTAIKAIKNIIKLNCSLVVKISICRLNFLCLKEYVDLLKSLEVKETTFWFIAPQTNIFKSQFLLPKLETVVPFIKEAIDYANSKNIHAGLTFLPFCLLDNYYIDYTVEIHMPDNLRTSDKFFEQGYKSKKCQKCRYYIKCPGIWKEYYQLRGFKFKPIIR